MTDIYVHRLDSGETISVLDPQDLPMIDLLEGNTLDTRRVMLDMIYSLIPEKDQQTAGKLSFSDLTDVFNKAFTHYGVDSTVVYSFFPENKDLSIKTPFGAISLGSFSFPAPHTFVSKNVPDKDMEL